MAPRRDQKYEKYFHEDMKTIDVREFMKGESTHPPPRVGGSAAEVKVVLDHIPFEETLDLDVSE